MDLSIFLPSLSTNDNSSSSDSSDVGPLIFNPIASSLTLLFSSPSFVPHTLPPNFITPSLSRFLTTIPDHNASTSLLPSSISSISADFGPQISSHGNATANFRRNGLQFLHCPGTTSVILFFPTGDNSDGVGFLVLYVNNQDSKLNAVGGISTTPSFNNHHRINNIAVVSLDPPSTNAAQPVGYLMVSTCYAVHWFAVEVVRGKASSDPVNPRLDFIGSTSFKKSPVVDACWNPHLPGEESLVLLESGELFLCHLDSFGISREKLKVGSDTCLGNAGGGGWLACVFSWHPRVIVVAHSNCVFLVDLRESEASSSILVKTDTYATSSRDGQFVALCGAGSEGFCFVVASTKRVILCDVRRPLIPLLQWDHHINDPYFINVLPLSEMRSHANESCYSSADKQGYCIMMGSFWNCEFCLFCYGPPPDGIAPSFGISKLYNLAYAAWGLPMSLSISGRGCHCGDCMLKDECLKDDLPKWIDWRQKKEIVLGFGVLGKDLRAKLFADFCSTFGGFTLVRLMSSGRIESQDYHASWKFMNAHVESSPSPYSERCLLYGTGDGDYQLPKRFNYLNLDRLSEVSCNELKSGVAADETFVNLMSRPGPEKEEPKILKKLKKQVSKFLQGSNNKR